MTSENAPISEAAVEPGWDDRSAVGLWILVVSLALGVVADTLGLLRIVPWGVNVPMWTATLVGSMVWLMRSQKLRFSTGQVLLLATAGFFAAQFAWRDANTLKVLDALAMGACLALAATRNIASREPLRSSSLLEYGLAGTFTGLYAVAGVIPLASDIRWRAIPRGTWLSHIRSVAVGLLIAGPLLLIFNGLFMSADKTYEETVKRLLEINFATPARHLIVIAVVAWLAAGFLRTLAPMLVRPLVRSSSGFLIPCKGFGLLDPRAPAPPFRLGIIEVGLPLALLDLLFFGFVLLQLPYLFGGPGWVQAPAGPTYAMYARQGFFELVAVAALTLTLLLAADWLLGDRPAREKILFRALAWVMVALVFTIMASALQRMSLYTHRYGLTHLRLYTTAFMFWLGVLTLWFGVTVLRGRGERFAFGVFVTGLCAIFLLHAVNPDAYIARTNLARSQGAWSHLTGALAYIARTDLSVAHESEQLDMSYLLSLSADAIPTLAAALPDVVDVESSPANRQAFAWFFQKNVKALACLFGKRDRLNEDDWRVWNWGRMRARRVLNQAWDRLPDAERTILELIIKNVKEPYSSPRAGGYPRH
jgi:hypothetical protein